MTFTSEATNHLLDEILNTSPNGILVVEAISDEMQEVIDFRYVIVNKAAREEISVLKMLSAGMTMKEVLAENDFLSVLSICRLVWLTGQPYQGERYYAETNEWFTTHFARLDTNRLLITFTNITSFKEVIYKHQQEAELFQSVLGSTSNPIVVGKSLYKDQSEIVDFQIVLFNKAAKDAWFFGSSLQVGTTASSLLPQPEQDFLLAFCRKAYQTAETQRFQYRYPDADRWFSMSVQRFNQGVILTATDITDERQHQNALRQANRALQQSNENLQQFAYIASHDLQEPLRKIHSFGNLLQNQFAEQLGPVGADMIGRMQAASGRMTTLIQDLLTYSRLTTHREDFRPVSLGRMLNEIIDDLEPLIQEGQAIINCEDLPTIAGDKSQLRQLFQNLLINAVKFRHPDRPPIIQLQCRTLEPHDIPAGLPTGRPYVEVSVQDNGIGFDERYTDRIFQMFQRLHGRSQYTGTGVGLAICKRVVENHHGAITANSTPGEGATFRVILPIQGTD